ncbi:hypothetical protein PVAND_014785 [Polypedilum vanderplanki]|uniref:Uncharacterized protein n=1 Tax=Polypedilum vanderplanki TaxID=319348 RepID=A0A9J6BAR3_POLVA|nr:hypothetical protein PVAND_014785 [Polypedilum vanderplanki]
MFKVKSFLKIFELETGAIFIIWCCIIFHWILLFMPVFILPVFILFIANDKYFTHLHLSETPVSIMVFFYLFASFCLLVQYFYARALKSVYERDPQKLIYAITHQQWTLLPCFIYILLTLNFEHSKLITIFVIVYIFITLYSLTIFQSLKSKFNVEKKIQNLKTKQNLMEI